MSTVTLPIATTPPTWGLGPSESGQVWVNQHLAIGPHIPMAGFKQSGLGVEQGVEGLAEYAQVQVVNIKR